MTEAGRAIVVFVWTNPGTGEPAMSAEGLALLFGVSVDELRAKAIPGELDTRKWIPAEWFRAGRRRSGEAMAHGNSGALFDAVQYWAAKEHGAKVEFRYLEEPPAVMP